MKEHVKAALEGFVEEELKLARAKHKPMQAAHEVYGVVKEEIEECQEAFDEVKEHFDRLWENVKRDMPIGHHLGNIYQHALHTAQEALQVAAMVKRSLEDFVNEDHKNYYMVVFMYGASEKAPETDVIDKHPTEWEKEANTLHPGQYKMISWTPISEREYNKFKEQNSQK